MKPRRCLPQRGVVAIETAFLLLTCFMLLPFMLYFSRLALHSAVLQQAAFDAARYVATLPREQIRDAALQATALNVARGLIVDAVAGAQLDTLPNAIEIECDYIDCDQMSFSGAPALVSVRVTLLFRDPVFMEGFTGMLVPYEYPLAYDAVQRYGN